MSTCGDVFIRAESAGDGCTKVGIYPSQIHLNPLIQISADGQCEWVPTFSVAITRAINDNMGGTVRFIRVPAAKTYLEPKRKREDDDILALILMGAL